MKHTIFLLAFIILPFCLQGQIKYDYNWVLGYDTNSSTPEGEGIIISFLDEQMTVDFVEKDMEMHVDNGTMSDKEGNLLFYTNGCFIANKEHEVMENGGGINPGEIHQSYCAHGYPMVHGILILPAVNNSDLYYIFHHRANYPDPFYSDFFYYSLVDMTLDDNKGAVIEKNIPILEDSLWSGYLTAVKHANNTDWWIIAAKGFSNEFYKILLSENGIEVTATQTIGQSIDIGSAGCQAVFSPDGSKYIWYDQIRNVQVFDFDRGTGELSNPIQLFVADTVYFGGAAVSPDSRFLYISNAIYLYQYDLQAPDIQASKVVIDTFDGFNSPFPANFFLMQLGPDCRIYMSTGNGADRLHVINYPNRKGKDCGFQQHAIKLPQSNASTIPNYPNYRLGTPYPVCDSTIQLVTSTVRVRPPVQEVRAWPNPATTSLTLELPAPLPAGAVWSLHAATGQPVRQQELATGQTQHTIPLAGLPPGLYFWEVSSEGRRVGSGKVVIQH